MEMKYLLVLLLLPMSLCAEPWTSDSDGSFGFEASFEGEPLPGEFKRFSVEYSEQSSLRVTVPVAASDMGDDEMTAILHDSIWLAVERFGEARFEASTVNCSENGDCLAEGELSLKGVSQPLRVPFTWVADGDFATMRGGLSIDRTEFNVGSGEWSNGESIAVEVKLSFEIRMRRAN